MIVFSRLSEQQLKAEIIYRKGRTKRHKRLKALYCIFYDANFILHIVY